MLKTETTPSHVARKPTDADRFAGQRLRQGRRELGLTQEALAHILGVTFQQIQKYESGQSRMSAGRLREVAIALGKPVAWFYEPFDLPEHSALVRSEDLRASDLRREARRLVDELADADRLDVVVRLLNALVGQST